MPSKKAKRTSKKNKKKSSRKIWIGLGAAAILMGGIATAVFLKKQKAEVEVDLVSLSEEVNTLHSTENHREVIESIGEHLYHFRDDAATLKLYASSQLKVPQPGNLHVSNAMKVYRRVLELEPEDIESNQTLFELSVRLNDQNQSIKYGKNLLKLLPHDCPLHTKIAAEFVKNKQYNKALEIADATLETDPGLVDAYRLKIEAMLANGCEENEILEFIGNAVNKHKDVVNKSDLLMIYAVASGNKDDFVNLVEGSSQSVNSSETSAWKVESLEKSGKHDMALEVLKAATDSGTQSELARGLAYRYWQRGEFLQVQEELVKLASSQPLNEELLVLDSLAKIYNDQKEAAKTPNSKLKKLVSQFARSWHPILDQLSKDNPDSIELQRACEAALSFYPQSGYLFHCYGTAFELSSEQDLAIQKHRIAIKYAPRWVVPRISLGRLLLNKQQNELAFYEATSALQVNPSTPAAFEVVLLASLNIADAGQSFPTSRLKPICNTLAEISSQTKDESLRLTLSATEKKLKGDKKACDEFVSTLVDKDTQLDASLLQVLGGLATDPKLLARIDQLVQKSGQSNLPNQISNAIAQARSNGLKAGLELLSKINFDEAQDPNLSQGMATAQLHTVADSPKAKSLWLVLSKEYQDNPRVQQLVLTQPVLEGDRDAQKEVIDRLKVCSNGQGVTWKLAEAKWLLNGDDSQKTAANVVIKLTNVLRQAPTSEAAYLLITEAYDRLLQPQQALAALQTAVNNGMTNPSVLIEFAERLTKQKQNTMASMQAYKAGASALATKEIRMRASVVLIDVEAHQRAIEIIEVDLPEKPAETDDDFQVFAAYVMANAKIGKTKSATEKIADMAKSTERWFGLWLDSAVLETTTANDSVSMLKQAMTWPQADDSKRRSEIARAWSRIAIRENNKDYFKHAISTLNSRPVEEWSPKLQFQLAAIYHRAEDAENAIKIYDRLIKDSSNPAVEAAAKNNLATLLAEDTNNLNRSEQLSREAVKLVNRPEYAETLANILCKQDRQKDAVEFLKNQTEESDSLLLRVSLAETLLQLEDFVAAKEAISAAEKLRSVKTSLKLWQRMNAVQKALANVDTTN